MLKYIQNILIFLTVYLPPIIIFTKYFKKRGIKNVLSVIIFITYIIASLLTDNLIPFIFVLICIRYLKTSGNNFHDSINNNFAFNREDTDYLRYGFNIKKLKIIKAIKYSSISYFITFSITIISTVLLSYIFKENLKNQEIITEAMNLPIKQFLIMVPMMVIFAPVVEEFIFRWLFFEKIFKGRVGIIMSAIITSGLFSLVHFNLKAAPILFAVGMINCYLIHEKGYWYAVFNHSVFNLVTVLALFMQKIY